MNWLRNFDRRFDRVALFLSLAWLVILIFELLGEQPEWMFQLGTALWMIFLAQFALKIWLAPKRGQFLASNFLFGLALFIPLVRFLHLQQELPWMGYLTASAGAQLVWIFGTLNFSIRKVNENLRRRGVHIVGVMTGLVALVGAAALYHYENSVPGQGGIHSYTEALWWTAMQMTTIGSGYTPVTTQGQAVALAISIYACGVFGYLTATLATVLVGQDAADPQSSVASQKSINQLLEEVAALRDDLRSRK